MKTFGSLGQAWSSLIIITGRHIDKKVCPVDYYFPEAIIAWVHERQIFPASEFIFHMEVSQLFTFCPQSLLFSCSSWVTDLYIIRSPPILTLSASPTFLLAILTRANIDCRGGPRTFKGSFESTSGGPVRWSSSLPKTGCLRGCFVICTFASTAVKGSFIYARTISIRGFAMSLSGLDRTNFCVRCQKWAQIQNFLQKPIGDWLGVT